MLLSDIIKQAAAGIKDRECVVIPPLEWMEIFAWEIQNLYPDVYYSSTKEIDPTTLTDSYVVDLSSETGLRTISDILFELEAGNQIPYDTWYFDAATKKLYLSPLTFKKEILDARSAKKILINWKGIHPAITNLGQTVSLNFEGIELLQSAAKKEVLKRIMFDSVKLDRYRTLIGDVNIYALLALERQVNLEMELQKRKTREADIGTF